MFVGPSAWRTPRGPRVRRPDDGGRQPGIEPWLIDPPAVPVLAAYFRDLRADPWPRGDRCVDHVRHADRRADQRFDLDHPLGGADGVVPVLGVRTQPRIAIH